MPPAYNTFPNPNGATGPPAGMGTLQYFLLPFLEQQPLYNQVTDTSDNIMTVPLKVFMGPADPTMPGDGIVPMMTGLYGGCSYSSNYVVFGNNPGGSARLQSSFPDGTSNTIVFGQTYTSCGMMTQGWSMGMCGCPPTWPYYYSPDYFLSLPLPQAAPSLDNCDPMRLQTPYAGGILVSLADGSVRTVSTSVSQYSWNLALNPADGKVFDATWPAP